MKKTWVKRSEIYPKPFYKQKLKMLLLMLFLLCIIFTIYNFISINELSQASTPLHFLKQTKPANEAVKELNNNNEAAANEAHSEESLTIIRGIRLFDYDAYKPNYEGKFTCLDGKQEIPFSRVNDDYCDCNDGTDEPSTNACNNGKFYCKYQKPVKYGRGHDHYISSSRINDGVCDCCDGSDEWLRLNCKTNCL